VDIEKLQERASVKALSIKHENKVKKFVAGRTTIASGALPFDKADVVKDNIRIECKATEKESIILKLQWLHKLQGECLAHEIPVLNIQIKGENYYLVRPEEFRQYLEYKEILKEMEDA